MSEGGRPGGKYPTSAVCRQQAAAGEALATNDDVVDSALGSVRLESLHGFHPADRRPRLLLLLCQLSQAKRRPSTDARFSVVSSMLLPTAGGLEAGWKRDE